MKSRKKDKLANAIESSKSLIDYEANDSADKSYSRFAELAGIPKGKKGAKTSLLQKAATGDKRTSFARIADNVLGEESRHSSRVLEFTENEINQQVGLGPWIQSRINVLRNDNIEKLENVTESAGWAGHNESGEPFWKVVLNERRNTATWEKDGNDGKETYLSDALPSLEEPLAEFSKWPPHLPRNEQRTFKNFHVCRENDLASLSVNEILDKPADKINPLLIMGESGTGKTHLLWATGWAFSKQLPCDCVRIFSCSIIDSDFSLPKNWNEMLDRTSALLIDDVDLIYSIPDAMHAIGQVIDWAINIGIQVVLTASSQYTGVLHNRLSEVLRSAVVAELQTPSIDSLLMMLRQRISGRQLLLTDSMLEVIISESDKSWASCQATLEKVAIGIEGGVGISDSKDVAMLLRNPSQMRGTEQIEESYADINLEEKGAEIAAEVLDTVFADPLSPAIDIHTELPNIGSDDYVPPDLMPDDSEAAINAIVQRHLGEELEQLNKRRDHALRVDERDAHLITKAPDLDAEIRGKVAEQLSPIEMVATAGFGRIQDELLEHQKRLAKYEKELFEIGAQVETADAKELINLVDKLRDVQISLTEIDPDSLPLPEFVDAKIRRRPVRKKPEIVRLPILSPRPILPVKRDTAHILPVFDPVLIPVNNAHHFSIKDSNSVKV